MLARNISKKEKALIFLVSFLVVVFAMVQFRIWSIQQTHYFFRTDRWLEIIFVIATATAITMLLSWLLQLEFSIFTGGKPVKPRRRH